MLESDRFHQDPQKHIGSRGGNLEGSTNEKLHIPVLTVAAASMIECSPCQVTVHCWICIGVGQNVSSESPVAFQTYHGFHYLWSVVCDSNLQSENVKNNDCVPLSVLEGSTVLDGGLSFRGPTISPVRILGMIWFEDG